MPQQLVSIEDDIKQDAAKFGVPADLALAVAEQESGFNPTAVNPDSGAFGTFQFLPSTAKSRGLDPNDQRANVTEGVKYLRELLDKHQGDPEAVLKEYGGVKNDTTYVPSVLARLPKFKDVQAAPTPTAPPPTAAPPSPASSATPLRDAAKDAILDTRIGPFTPRESVGAIRAAAARVSDLGTRVRGMFPSLNKLDEVVPPVQFKTEPQNASEKIGQAAERALEFAVPGGAVTKGVQALKAGPIVSAGLEALGQAGVGYGVTKAQGGTEGEAKINAALGAAGPVVSTAMEAVAPKIIIGAQKKLARVLAQGLENKGPMVDYAIKSGQIGNAGVAKDVQIVGQAAADLLDLPVRASWGRWQTELAQSTGLKTQSLKAALAGDLGSQEVGAQQLIDSLDNLIEVHTKHLAEIPSGDWAEIAYDPALQKQLVALKDQLSQYGGSISVRNLSDIKRVWDDAVFTLGTAGKVGVGPETLTATAMKEANYMGANEIRRVLEKEVPDISALNQAVTHSIRLEKLVEKLHAANPSMSPTMKNFVTAAGAAVGVGASHGMGMPGWGGSILGAHLGGAAARGLVVALESPLWKTLRPATKASVAKAIADGRSRDVLKLITPVLQSQIPQQATTP